MKIGLLLLLMDLFLLLIYPILYLLNQVKRVWSKRSRS